VAVPASIVVFEVVSPGAGHRRRDQAWRRDAADAAGPIRLPGYGIDLTLDEVYAGVEFD
jgi:hypothetical protein